MRKRVIIRLEDEFHRALKLKSAATDRTISDLVNEAVHRDLTEDADDLAVLEERDDEPVRALEEVVRTLRERGEL